jgi:hypothetical protein
MAERTMRLGVALNGYGLIQDRPEVPAPEILPWHELLLIAGEDVPDPQDPATWGKVGRNDPCPCGSGRKYKKCHGAAA